MHDVRYARCRFDTVTGSYLDSMEDLLAWDFNRGKRIAGPIRVHVPSLGVIEGMNQIGEAFLESDSEWLWLTDADMGFPADILDRLLYAADPVERPAVGALVFKYMLTGSDGCNGQLGEERPVILDWGQDENGDVGFVGRRTYPPNTVVRCDATGMACVLIHRSVYQRMVDKYGPVWHDPLPFPGRPGKYLGTDVSFWVRAGMLDIPLHIHTGAVTNHQKTCWVSDASYRARRPELFTDDPATEPVPTNRAERRRKKVSA